ncbi:uncharacterized protein LOC109285574 [Alligator mississippiensis]|uniref:uncharacterized protein LOC109285574 n=1 Tax=Alligator mississippiensis TaxID=8496 RepID=UPI00287791B1|nr:uncharacterized protein LOC109285574 [Alligator mississippiensis]
MRSCPGHLEFVCVEPSNLHMIVRVLSAWSLANSMCVRVFCCNHNSSKFSAYTTTISVVWTNMHLEQFKKRTMWEGPDAAVWKMATSRANCCTAEATSPVQLGNRYKDVASLEERVTEEATSTTTTTTTTSMQTKRQPDSWKKRPLVVVVGNSLLRGIEGVIRHLDHVVWEVCCLPRAQIQHVTARIPDLIRPSNYYPIVLNHMRTNDTARSSPGQIMSDYKALGARLQSSGVPVTFLLIHPVSGHGPHRDSCIREFNMQLQSWCHCAGFGFLDHGPYFQERGMLERDSFYLSSEGSEKVSWKRPRKIIGSKPPAPSRKDN